MFDKQPLLLWLSQFGDSFHKFWSSINKVDKENKDTGHIKDTGGPYENLQAIVKCGTSEFLGKLQDASSAREMSERPHWPVLGFYLTFLVANKVVMTSKNNDGNHTQHNWESDAESFSVNEEPTKDDMVEEEEKKEEDEWGRNCGGGQQGR